MRDHLTIALVHEVFFDASGAQRLRDRLAAAAAAGADLALLPELPLHPWAPASREARDEDAEPPGGPRAGAQARAAREAGIGLVGGAIVRDPNDGRRYNTALVFDRTGALIATCGKAHMPEEEGFWETSHYEPARPTLQVIDGMGMPIGIQICSDVNRPEGSHLLGALGAELIAAPRATERTTWPRWRVVLLANAITSCAYVASVNRPGPERGVDIGGPSIVVDPQGEVLLETSDPLALLTLTRSAVARARAAYPGYLPVRADLYAAGWNAVAAGVVPAARE